MDSVQPIAYKLSNEPPEPIYSEAKQRWGVDFDKGVIFTYGDTIHSKLPLTPDLLAHELVHVGQQTEMGKYTWWKRYFEDPAFRLDQEKEAYKMQYRTLKTMYLDRNAIAKSLLRLAELLSGRMYGHLITRGEAIKVISG